MIRTIKKIFKIKDVEPSILDILEEKYDAILDILEEKYDDYGNTVGIIYLTREEYERYTKYIIKKINTHTSLTYSNFDYMGIKVEIDPSILREEKLNQLLNG